MADIPLNFQTLIELDTNPSGTAVWSPLAAGISSYDPSTNDETDQTKYLDGDGFGETTVIGAQYIISITGHRFIGDEAQDFVYNLQFQLGDNRKTQARITDKDGNVISGDCTIANIDFGGGDAGAKTDISFEIHFNGEPTSTPQQGADALSITVAAGSVAGSTSFTATPDAGNTLAYSVTTASIGAVYESEYVDGLTTYTSGDDIPGVSESEYLNAYELDSNGRVDKFVEYVIQAADIA